MGLIMRKITTAFGVLGTIAVLFLAMAPAQAQLWTSGTGSDANDCFTAATPCRNIGGATGALARSFDGGTIHVLPGAYSAVVIDSTIQIIADEGWLRFLLTV